jgi:hypothetical protein
MYLLPRSYAADSSGLLPTSTRCPLLLVQYFHVRRTSTLSETCVFKNFKPVWCGAWIFLRDFRFVNDTRWSTNSWILMSCFWARWSFGEALSPLHESHRRGRAVSAASCLQQISGRRPNFLRFPWVFWFPLSKCGFLKLNIVVLFQFSQSQAYLFSVRKSSQVAYLELHERRKSGAPKLRWVTAVLDFKLWPWDEYCVFVFGWLYGIRGELADDVSELPMGPIFTGQTNVCPVKMGPTGSTETSTANSPRISCNYPKTKKK